VVAVGGSGGGGTGVEIQGLVIACSCTTLESLFQQGSWINTR
jgi:hypothetical protein